MQTIQHQMSGRRPSLPTSCLALLVLFVGVLLAHPSGASAAASCPNGATLSIVAHEDDSFLFQSPDLLHDIQNGRCVRTVFITAGDAGLGQNYWSSREKGAEAAYANMAGVASNWTQSDAGISGHPMPLMTLSGAPNISIVFMRLPDGGSAGGGFAADNYQTLRKLWLGSITNITAVDGSSSYSKLDLINTLTALMKSFGPDRIDTQDWVGTYNDGDHSDHHTAAYLVQQASRGYNTTLHQLVGYMGYPSQNKPANVTGTDFTAKLNAFIAYGKYDSGACSSQTACQNSAYWAWLQAQYTTGSEVDGPGFTYPPLASAGRDHLANYSSTVTLDGSGSYDPDGGTTNYRWTQTAGPAVQLSSSTVAKPTFTAPSSNATLTFQLVVSDGSQVSQPDTINITITGPDLALQATPTASSQALDAGQGVSNAVDGVIGGYPGDSSAEWSTIGGGAGSWMKLTWAGPITTNQVVLYDRPNLGDQITSATLTFSDGSTVSVGALNNDGSATTVNFPTTTTNSLLMTVKSVSSSTQNVGLSEIMVFAPGAGSLTPTANAGSDQSVTTGSTVTLDGSGSFDPAGNPSYHWTQTAGPAVTLSSSTAVKPTFTAPGSATTLTFQLVVTDGTATSQPSTVNVTVNPPGPANIAPLATVTASSQNASSGQTADKAVDGFIDGYPGDYTKEWATVGGGAGSWLKLVWPSSYTVNKVVLYDRPNTFDQITGATLTFSDGSTVQAPALNNDGSATTVTFASKTTTSLLMTVTSVSPSTGNVGLSEIQVYPSGGSSQPPTANAGSNQTVAPGTTVTLNGSGSFDPNGNPSYQWTQTGGTAVTLSSATAVMPTFTAPATTGTLTFQLVVSDGALSSQPSSVTVTVANPPADMALAATATASSQNTSTGQTADKAIDGVIDGYPGDYTKEWATVAGGVGSWLNLAWSTPQTMSKVVLYDRPNANDQITGATLTFSDGSTVQVPALNNDGTATTVTFPAKTTTSLKVTVTSVSASTQNVGLSEIQAFS